MRPAQGEATGTDEIAPGSGECGEYADARRVLLPALEQPLGLLEPTLGEPQLGQPRGRLAGEVGLGVDAQLERSEQVPLGGLPLSGVEQDRAAVGATGRIKVLVAEALLEGVGGVDPLQGVRELGGLGAAGDEVAAGVHDGVGSPGLAGQGGSHRLVEQGRALLPAPLLDQGGPQLAEGAQLQVGVAVPAGGLARLGRPPLGGDRVGAVMGAQQRHPAGQRRQPSLLDHARGPGQPAPCDRGPAQARAVGEVEPDGAHRRVRQVVAVAEGGIRALVVLHRGLGLTHPPEHVGEPRVRLCGRLPRERVLKGGPCAGPLSGRQGRAPRCQQVVGVGCRHPLRVRGPPTRRRLTAHCANASTGLVADHPNGPSGSFLDVAHRVPGFGDS